VVAVTTWEGVESFSPGRLNSTRAVVGRAAATSVSCVRPSAATYRRRRAVAAGLVAVVVGSVVWAVAALPGGGPLPAPGPSRPAAGRAVTGAPHYVVQPGDTLWTIARRLQPQGDVRPLVDRLASAHGGPVLYVGERIALPPP
jgi:hypothetical protein